MDGQPWEVWDSVSGNLIFTGTPGAVVMMLRGLDRQGDDALSGLTAGPADDSQVWPAAELLNRPDLVTGGDLARALRRGADLPLPPR